MPRNNRESTHDREVRQQAEKLAGKGYKVSADIPGYPTPKPIGRKNPTVPDVVATKGSSKVMLEVETSQTVDSTHTKQQLQTMNRSAGQQKNTSVKLVVTKGE